MKARGNVHRLSFACTPQKNGVAECMNRTIFSSARALLNYKFVLKRFWAVAVATAAYIRSMIACGRTPSNKSPTKLWSRRKPDSSLLHVFGPPCWSHEQRKVAKNMAIAEALLY